MKNVFALSKKRLSGFTFFNNIMENKSSTKNVQEKDAECQVMLVLLYNLRPLLGHKSKSLEDDTKRLASLVFIPLVL